MALWFRTPDLSRDILVARHGGDGRLVEVLGAPLHLSDSGAGAGTPVILIHGFGSSLGTWDGWVPGLAATRRVIAVDLPGSGLSPPDATGDYTDTRVVTLLVALMDQLGVAQADMVGNSIGGRIAFTLAAGHPERVRRLVLVSPDGFASPGFAYGVAPKVPAVMGLMRQFLPKSMLRANLAVAYADPSRLRDATVDRYHDLLRAPGARQALLDRMAQTVLVDPVPMLRRITVPVLLLWGEGDGMIPIANAEDYLAVLPDARLVRLPGLGHVPQEEDPATSLGPVMEFLSE